jgi:hypothetical protein
MEIMVEAYLTLEIQWWQNSLEMERVHETTFWSTNPQEQETIHRMKKKALADLHLIL